MICRAKIASVPMSLAIAVMIAVSAHRSSAERGGQPNDGGGETKSATASVASVAEPPLPSASRRPPPRRRLASDAAASPSTTPWSRSVCLAQRVGLLRLHQRRGADVGQHRVEVVLALGQERIQEARRAGVVRAALGPALEQPPVLEEHVHELPQHVVEGLDELLVDEGVLVGGTSSHSAPSAENATVRHPSGGRQRSRRPARGPSRRSPKAITMSSGAPPAPPPPAPRPTRR